MTEPSFPAESSHLDFQVDVSPRALRVSRVLCANGKQRRVPSQTRIESKGVETNIIFQMEGANILISKKAATSPIFAVSPAG